MKVQVGCVVIVRPIISLSYPVLLLCTCNAREEDMDDCGLIARHVMYCHHPFCWQDFEHAYEYVLACSKHLFVCLFISGYRDEVVNCVNRILLKQSE